MIRLLIIEDDPNTLTGLLELLSQEGFETRGAGTGRQAIEMFRKKPDDVVLCDYRLPDKDGISVCAELQKIRPQVKLIIITAYSRAEIMACAKEIGVLKIINKPIALDRLLSAISEAGEKAAKDLSLI